MNKILVIGDPMIDIHMECSSSRLSPEAPVPICLLKNQREILGGSANVAAQVAVGHPCIMAYVQSNSSFKISNNFNKFRIMCNDNQIELLPLTTTRYYKIPKKTRIWSNKQQVCRIDDELQAILFTEDTQQRWLSQIQKCIKENNVRLIILSDYNKGIFNDDFLQEIIYMAHKLNIITILDPKRPTYRTLQYISIVTPNDAEMEKTILEPNELSNVMGNTYLIHTMGVKGMDCYKNSCKLIHVPAHKVDVADSCGCGDTVIAFLALTLDRMHYDLNDNNIRLAMSAASFAASRTVMHRGSYVLNSEEERAVFGLIK